MTGLLRDLSLGELHCHADGLLDPPMARTMSGDEDLAKELEAVYPVASFHQWTKAYDPILVRFLNPLAQRQQEMILAHVARLHSQQVRYAELFISRVILGIEDEGCLIEWFRALRHRLDSRADSPRVNLVACIGRGPREKAVRQAGRIEALAREGLIAGIALAGDEATCSVREYEVFLNRCRDLGLGIEIHAGETGGPEVVRDALEYGRPQRLGHAVRAFEDEALAERLCREGVHLEFCPTSNLCLGVIPDIRHLPVRQALELGIPFSINTDDPGPFSCSLESEFKLVSEAFNLNREELEHICSSTLKAAFGPTLPGLPDFHQAQETPGL
jgi:adenosine deaminase